MLEQLLVEEVAVVIFLGLLLIILLLAKLGRFATRWHLCRGGPFYRVAMMLAQLLQTATRDTNTIDYLLSTMGEETARKLKKLHEAHGDA